MKREMIVLTVFFLAACMNLPDARKRGQLLEEKFSGAHAVLADCVATQLQSDGRAYLRPLQFRNRQYPDIQASEIHAYDTRYLRNAHSTYAPSNPDAILIYGPPVAEILPASQRSENDKPIYAFALLLQQIDSATINASLRGDPFMGDIAWKILQRCAAKP